MAFSAIIPPRLMNSREPSAALTLRRAWVLWFALMGTPFILFLLLVWWLTDAEVPVATKATSQIWFLINMAYLGLVIPAAFLRQSRTFKAYWSGHVVTTHDYLRGMLTIWLALEVSSLLGLLGCLLNGKLMPCLLPALISFMIYISLWPSGRAMTRPAGNEDDAELYEDPR